MTDEELRALAEVARDNPGWTHVAYLEALSAFRAAASPDVVLGLLDRLDTANAALLQSQAREAGADARIAELEASNRDCVDTVAEWGAKAGALQTEVDRVKDKAKQASHFYADDLRTYGDELRKMRRAAGALNTGIERCQRERDEAREAVKRLAGALDELANGGLEFPGAFAEGALDDPIVKRIVEGE